MQGQWARVPEAALSAKARRRLNSVFFARVGSIGRSNLLTQASRRCHLPPRPAQSKVCIKAPPRPADQERPPPLAVHEVPASDQQLPAGDGAARATTLVSAAHCGTHTSAAQQWHGGSRRLPQSVVAGHNDPKRLKSSTETPQVRFTSSLKFNLFLERVSCQNSKLQLSLAVFTHRREERRLSSVPNAHLRRSARARQRYRAVGWPRADAFGVPAAPPSIHVILAAIIARRHALFVVTTRCTRERAAGRFGIAGAGAGPCQRRRPLPSQGAAQQSVRPHGLKGSQI